MKPVGSSISLTVPVNQESTLRKMFPDLPPLTKITPHQVEMTTLVRKSYRLFGMQLLPGSLSHVPSKRGFTSVPCHERGAVGSCLPSVYMLVGRRPEKHPGTTDVAADKRT